MRIVIDIQSVIGKKTGIGKYTESLVKALSRLSSPYEFILFYFNFRSRFKGIEVDSKNFKNKGVKLPGRVFSFLWKKVNAPRFDRLSGEADLFHFPNIISRPVKSGKVVVTVHDLAFRRFPQYIEKKNLAFLNSNFPKTLAKADKIVAVSEFTKEELLKFYPISEEKIKVIHEGVDENFRKIEDKEELNKIKKKYRLPENFFLWVGAIEPRKNISGLLEAFSVFKEKTLSDYKLVMVGKWGWNYQGFLDKMKKMLMAKDVIFTEYVTDEELPLLYNLAKVFIFPSFYEGFGLPPLEAMACGLPVITTSALSEVVKDAAIIVLEPNTQEIAQAIKNLLENENLRQDLIQKGLKRAEEFSWDKTALETLALYEDLLEQNK